MRPTEFAITPKLAPDYARFVIVQNSQFSIHIRFANNANGHIRRI